MKRPIESDYISQVAYTRALEAYCDRQERIKRAEEAFEASQFNPDWSMLEAVRESLREHMSRIKELEAKLAQQEQIIQSYLEKDNSQQEQGEPVAWMRQDGQRVTTASDRHNYPDYETRYSIPFYTTPQQRTWVGLTDEDTQEIYLQNHAAWQEFAKAIEAKLKEKNT